MHDYWGVRGMGRAGVRGVWQRKETGEEVGSVAKEGDRGGGRECGK